MAAPPKSAVRNPQFTAVLTGNPNCGKTTLFNALTGLRAKVGNYAGVTVERKEGAMLGADSAHPVAVLDLPGTYSLSPQSLDEQISRDVLFQRLSDVPEPSLVIVVVDASNLQRNLYYATQVIELGHPTFLALNMVDVARENGHEIDLDGLSAALGVPVLPLVASEGEGVKELKAAVNQWASERVSEKASGSDLKSVASGLLAYSPTGSLPAAALPSDARRSEPRSFQELPENFGHEAQAIEAKLEKLRSTRLAPRTLDLDILLYGDACINSSRLVVPHPRMESRAKSTRPMPP